MQNAQDLIIEIGTEELPPMFINQMVSVFKQQLIQQLELKKLTFYKVTTFSTPRRIAVLVEKLSSKQPEELKIKKGPSLTVAYDENGRPTRALLGFINSLNINLNQLVVVNDGSKKSSWVEYHEKKLGHLTIDLLPEIIKNSMEELPGPKMSWGDGEFNFIRPVHWVLSLFGVKIVDCNLLGVQSNHFTYGHRFIANKPIKILEPLEYQEKLENFGSVIADFNQRKELIISRIKQIEEELHAKCNLDENLLEQVTNMVEYPVVLFGEFNSSFLKLPYECLNLVMKNHQKSFSLTNANNKLLPKFILISNNKSKDNIILGNQKVMHARLEDAMFLYNQDLKTPIAIMLEKLKKVVLQEKLGDLYTQSVRIKYIAMQICHLLKGDIEQQTITMQSGMFCKFDLVSNLVLEFPELQGIMGGHYLKLQKYDEQIVTAVTEHYLPKFSEDKLPSNFPGICIAIADRLNLLCGMFLIGIMPTGDKDPFGLRRACLGIIRILIEKKLSLNILELFKITLTVYSKTHKFKEMNIKTIYDKLINFTLERLKNWYVTNIENFNINFFYAVVNQGNNNLYDIDLRLKALLNVNNSELFANLIAANKRIVNLLNKSKTSNNININFNLITTINVKLLKTEAEQALYKKILELQEIIQPLVYTSNYVLIFHHVLTLVPLIDTFFDNVMVFVDEENLQKNRISLLLETKLLFSQVANFEKL